MFFRRSFFNNFRYISGDDGDGRLIAYLYEHWVQVLRGTSSWRNPAFFYPTGNTLGYSDTFVLNELFYAPLRFLGLDMFLAYQWTLIALTALGYTGMYQLCRRILPNQRLICALLAAGFTFSNMLFIQVGHSQLYSIYWLPLVLLLVLRIRQGRHPGRFAFLAGLLVGLLFLSTYYVPWFAVICAGLWLLLAGALQFAGGARPTRVRAAALAAKWWRPSLLAVLGSAVGLIPFLVVYLPVLGLGSRSYNGVLAYASAPQDIFNTGARNFLWAPLARAVSTRPQVINNEVSFALTPLTLLTLALCAVYLMWRVATGRAGDARTRLGLASAIVAVAAIILPMSVHGHTLWYFVWHLVPGAKAIRAIDRIGIITGLLTPLIIAWVIADVSRDAADQPDSDQDPSPAASGRTRRWRAVALVVVAILTVEQFNTSVTANTTRPTQLAELLSTPGPPSSCRAFYIAAPADRKPAVLPEVDAMLISQAVDLPTINGYSGQNPPGYGALANPSSPNYLKAVDAWAKANRITSGLCAYDASTRHWTVRAG